MANKNLNAAKTAKKRRVLYAVERYRTRINNIIGNTFVERQCSVIVDDPYESNFFKYFALRFNQLGLKKLSLHLL